MWTGSSAAVRSVTAARAASGSRLSVTGSMSANTGRAPSYSGAFAEATNENGVVITSSPAFTPAARSARCRPAVPLETAEACGDAELRREGRLEARQHRPEREHPRAQDLEHELLLARAEDGSGERDQAVTRLGCSA